MEKPKSVAKLAIDHSLLSNGLDFVHSAVELINGNVAKNLKYAVLHLFAGTSLILKERVRLEHWSLLFSKVDDATLDKFNSGDFEGINHARLLHIIKNICHVELDKDGLKSLEELRKIRNKVEHFKFELTSQLVKPVSAKLLNFVIEFIDSHLDAEQLLPKEIKIFEEVKESSRRFDVFIEARLADAKVAAEKLDVNLLYCPDCFNKALIRLNDEPTFKCHVCYVNEVELDSVVDAHLDYELDISVYEYGKDGQELPQYECEECLREAFVPETKEYKNFTCLGCGSTSPIDALSACSRCDKKFNSNGETLCGNCYAEMYDE